MMEPPKKSKRQIQGEREQAALEVVSRLNSAAGVRMPREVGYDLREELVRRLDSIRWDEGRLDAALSACRERLRVTEGISGDIWFPAAFLAYVRNFGFPALPLVAREAEIPFGGCPDPLQGGGNRRPGGHRGLLFDRIKP
jgi:hypothetical protein